MIETLLQSPHFVYRIELSADGARLSGYELAAKLSFLLRNTTPDETLLGAAEAGELDSEARARPRGDAGDCRRTGPARRRSSASTAALFGLTRYESILKDTTLFPAYSEALNQLAAERRSAVLPAGVRGRLRAQRDPDLERRVRERGDRAPSTGSDRMGTELEEVTPGRRAARDS